MKHSTTESLSIFLPKLQGLRYTYNDNLHLIGNGVPKTKKSFWSFEILISNLIIILTHIIILYNQKLILLKIWVNTNNIPDKYQDKISPPATNNSIKNFQFFPSSKVLSISINKDTIILKSWKAIINKHTFLWEFKIQLLQSLEWEQSA